METLRGKTYTVRPMDPRDLERQLPKVWALRIVLALGLVGWLLIWLVISMLIVAVTP